VGEVVDVAGENIIREFSAVTVSDAGRFLCSRAKVAIVVVTVAAVNSDVVVSWRAWQGGNRGHRTRQQVVTAKAQQWW
jgi:hypothetical protein